MPLQSGSSEATVQSNLKEVYKSWRKTGRIGNSKPKNKRQAIRQAIAIAHAQARRSSRGKGTKKK